ncbi:MAG TPA: DUF1501 domain-containing protein [Planctomycetaceae bacterium]|nr:DUF1501 domain-containing protein [Planctomycetaceae bacterium]
MSLQIPDGMSRRHFMRHMAAGATILPAMQFMNHVVANADTVRKNQKACILLWMSGGPPTIDMWDLKPGSKNGGEFSPISTKGDMQISEHLPKTAMVMDELSIVRSMSTREADHNRGRYYLHTGFVPNPTVVHPTFGSVVSYELGSTRKDLQIPSFVSVGGGSMGPGFLGMANAPFRVGTDGRIDNVDNSKDRLGQRLNMLAEVESNFINSKRGEFPKAHKDVYTKAVNLMTSPQMEAFEVRKEPAEVQAAYGAPTNRFGQGCLLARRLVEQGVPFVEVDLGGWDLHNDVFNTLRDQRLPQLDQGMSALVADLKQRGLLEHTVIVWMGEFGRTPRINANVGRDHWAASWSTVIGGGGLKGGQALGATDKDGIGIESTSYTPGNIWATAAHALGIPLDTVHTSKRGRPMRLANGQPPISELIG